jgi:hypothetical protein
MARVFLWYRVLGQLLESVGGRVVTTRLTSHIFGIKERGEAPHAYGVP